MRIRNVQFDKDKLFFTSDTHFFHSNIIKYTNRPFKNREEMNDFIVEQWNKVVPKDGVVFHLGDFSLTANPKELEKLLNRLNGKCYLIIGNHEKDILGNKRMQEYFEGIYDVAEIYVKDDEITYGEQHIVMCHYPMLVWNASHRGSWQLFGHVHGELSNKGEIKHSPFQMDAGVDCNNFAPFTYQQVKEIITKQALNKK